MCVKCDVGKVKGRLCPARRRNHYGYRFVFLFPTYMKEMSQAFEGIHINTHAH